MSHWKAILQLTLGALVGAIALGLAACGGDGDDETQITLTSTGKSGAAVQIDAPDSIEPGTAEITFRNDGSKENDAQLLRVEGERSAADVATALGAAVSGKAYPDWFFAGGGVGPTPAGASKAVTQVLESGTYWVTQTGGNGPPKASSLASFEVTGENSDAELPSEPANVQAFEYSFKADGLKKGENTVLFENTGAQPHHLIIAPIKGGNDIADVKKAFSEQAGPPPIDQGALQSTAVVEEGTDQVVKLNLPKSGKYALFCFVTDRQGGPPHVVKGMVAEVDVK
jgi:hypothetical protein